MSVVVRGAKNAFRNWLRTGAVVLILAVAIGLALSMLVAKQAVEGRMNDLKSQIGTTLVVNPAGAQGQQGGGEPLTSDTVTAIKNISHVSAVDTTINFMLRNQDDTKTFMRPGSESSDATIGKTNLQSSIDPGTLGRRFNNASSTQGFKLPVRGIGVSGNNNAQGQAFKVTSGRALTAADATSALVGTDLAAKNNLKVGSTFMAYDATFTVVGIFDQGTKFANDAVAIPLAEAQTLSNQSGQVSGIVVTVDSIENLGTTSAAIKNKLGADKVDIISSQQNVQTAIDSLASVQNISFIGFIAALAAAAVVTLLVMLVIVRERRREIGVLKAIGGSNMVIVSQFVVEAVVIVAMAAVVGFGVALVSSHGIANALVSNSSSSQQSQNTPMQGSGRFGRFAAGGNGFQRATNLVGQVTATVGLATLVWGALAALMIAIVGSAVPAWLIAKVSPAEVMRGE